MLKKDLDKNLKSISNFKIIRMKINNLKKLFSKMTIMKKIQ